MMSSQRRFMEPVREGAVVQQEYTLEVFANAEGTITLHQDVNCGMGQEHRIALITPSELEDVTRALRKLQASALASECPDPTEVRLHDVELYVSVGGDVCLLWLTGEELDDGKAIHVEPYRVPALISALEKARSDLD